MNFTFVDTVRCESCGFIQLRKHFGDDGRCPMCQENGVESVK